MPRYAPQSPPPVTLLTRLPPRLDAQFAAGYVQPATRQSSCVACPMGQYSSQPQQLACTLCKLFPTLFRSPSPPQTRPSPRSVLKLRFVLLCRHAWLRSECHRRDAVLPVLGWHFQVRFCLSNRADRCSPQCRKPTPSPHSLPRCSESSGESQCAMCIPGRFSTTPGALTCEDCDAGTVNKVYCAFYVLVIRSCTESAILLLSSEITELDSRPCLIPQYAPFPGSRGCTDCPAGTAQRNPRSGTCGERFLLLIRRSRSPTPAISHHC